MGIDTDCFVHPERISPQLICPICTQVLERPVQTPSEHLFCEDELLEWMTRSQLCPVTNEKLEPNSIRKPGRIITNMLAELERYCPNRTEGCAWTGQSEQVESHYKVCVNRKKSDLLEELNGKDAIIAKLKKKVTALNAKLSEIEEENKSLTLALAICDRKLKVYDAFYESENNFYNDDSSTISSSGSSNTGISALQHIARLRNLTTMLEESKDAYDIRGGKK